MNFFKIPDAPLINALGEVVTLTTEQRESNALIRKGLSLKHWNDADDRNYTAELQSLTDPMTLVISEPTPDISANVVDAPAELDGLYKLFSPENQQAYRLEEIEGPEGTIVRRNRVWHLPEYRHNRPADGSGGVYNLYVNCGWRRHPKTGIETRGKSEYETRISVPEPERWYEDKLPDGYLSGIATIEQSERAVKEMRNYECDGIPVNEKLDYLDEIIESNGNRIRRKDVWSDITVRHSKPYRGSSVIDPYIALILNNDYIVEQEALMEIERKADIKKYGLEEGAVMMDGYLVTADDVNEAMGVFTIATATPVDMEHLRRVRETAMGVI